MSAVAAPGSKPAPYLIRGPGQALRGRRTSLNQVRLLRATCTRKWGVGGRKGPPRPASEGLQNCARWDTGPFCGETGLPGQLVRLWKKGDVGADRRFRRPAAAWNFPLGGEKWTDQEHDAPLLDGVGVAKSSLPIPLPLSEKSLVGHSEAFFWEDRGQNRPRSPFFLGSGVSSSVMTSWQRESSHIATMR